MTIWVTPSSPCIEPPPPPSTYIIYVQPHEAEVWDKETNYAKENSQEVRKSGVTPDLRRAKRYNR